MSTILKVAQIATTRLPHATSAKYLTQMVIGSGLTLEIITILFYPTVSISVITQNIFPLTSQALWRKLTSCSPNAPPEALYPVKDYIMHTPAPWEVVKTIGAPEITGDNRRIARILYDPGSEDEQVHANAQFIVTACNSHHDLLDALQLLLDAFIHKDDNPKGNKAKTDIIALNPDVRNALNVAREAIQKATGGT